MASIAVRYCVVSVWHVSKKVSAFACVFHYFGYLLDCLFRVAFLTLGGLIAVGLLGLLVIHNCSFCGVVCLFAPSTIPLWTTLLLAYSTTSVLHN